MKKIILSILLLMAFSVNAQVVNPVKWTSKVEKLSETEFNLVITGAIEAEWHVYSQFTPDGGPLPMVLEFKESKGNYELIGKPKESKYKKQFNDVFEVDEYLFEKSFMTESFSFGVILLTKILFFQFRPLLQLRFKIQKVQIQPLQKHLKWMKIKRRKRHQNNLKTK